MYAPLMDQIDQTQPRCRHCHRPIQPAADRLWADAGYSTDVIYCAGIEDEENSGLPADLTHEPADDQIARRQARLHTIVSDDPPDDGWTIDYLPGDGPARYLLIQHDGITAEFWYSTHTTPQYAAEYAASDEADDWHAAQLVDLDGIEPDRYPHVETHITWTQP